LLQNTDKTTFVLDTMLMQNLVYIRSYMYFDQRSACCPDGAQN